MNHNWVFRVNMGASFSPRQGPYVANLIDLDDLLDSKASTANLEDLFPELVLLWMRVVEEEAKHIPLEKEKEKITLNTLIERDTLLRRMASLQEKNKRLEEKSSNLHSDIFVDMEA